MGEVKSILIRLNLDNPEHRQAYEYLRNKNRLEYKSNSDLIAKAVNAYCGEDKADMKRVIKNCFAELMANMEISRKETVISMDGEDVAWDFIGGDKPDTDI